MSQGQGHNIPGVTNSGGQRRGLMRSYDLSTGAQAGLGIAGSVMQASDSAGGRAIGAALSTFAATGNPYLAAFAAVMSIFASSRARKKQKAAARRASVQTVQLRGRDAGRAIPLLYGRGESTLLMAYANAGNGIPLPAIGGKTLAQHNALYPGALQLLGNLTSENQWNRKDNRIWLQQDVITIGQVGDMAGYTINGMELSDKSLNGRFLFERRYSTESPIATAFEGSATYDRPNSDDVIRGAAEGLREFTDTFGGLSYITTPWYHAESARNLSLPIVIGAFGERKFVRTINRSGAGTEADPYAYEIGSTLEYSNNCVKVLLDRITGGPDRMYDCGILESEIDLRTWYAAQQAAEAKTTKVVEIKWPSGTTYAQTRKANNPWGRFSTLHHAIERYEEASDFTEGSSGSRSVAKPRVALKRYEFNGDLSPEDEYMENLEDIVDAMPGVMMYLNDDGKLALSHPDAETDEAAQSVVSIGDDDIVRATEVTMPTAGTMLNEATGRFRNNIEGGGDDSLTLPEFGSPLDRQLKAKDHGNRLTTLIDMPGVDNPFHAADFLDTYISLSRRGYYRTGTNLVGEGIEPGDVYTLSDSRAGLSNVRLRLVKQPEDGGSETVDVTGVYMDKDDYAVSFDSAKASFDAQEFPEDSLLAPIGVTADYGAFTSPHAGQMRVAWREPDGQADSHDGYTLERRVGTGGWTALAVLAEEQTSYVDSLPNGRNDITYRVNSRSWLGGVSDWAESPTVTVNVIQSNVVIGPLIHGCPPKEYRGVGSVYESNDGTGKLFTEGVDPFSGEDPVGILWRKTDQPFTVDLTKFTLKATGIATAGEDGYLTALEFKGSADRTAIDQISATVRGDATDTDTHNTAVAFRAPNGVEGSQRLDDLTESAGSVATEKVFSGTLTDSAKDAIAELMQVLPNVRVSDKNTAIGFVRLRPNFTPPRSWVRDAGSRIAQIRVFRNGDVAISMALGQHLTDHMETNLRMVLSRRRDGVALNMPGPNATVNQTQDDDGHWYRWTPEAALQTQAAAFYTSTLATDSMDVLLYDDSAESPLDLLLAEASKRCAYDVTNHHVPTAEGTEGNVAYREADLFQALPISQAAPAVPARATFNFATFELTGIGTWSATRPVYNPATHQVWGTTAVANTQDALNDVFSFDPSDWATPVLVNSSGDLDLCYKRFDKVDVVASDSPPAGNLFPPATWHDSPDQVPAGEGKIYQVAGHRNSGQAQWTFSRPPVPYEGDDGISMEVSPRALFISNDRTFTTESFDPQTLRVHATWRRAGQTLLEVFADFDVIDTAGGVSNVEGKPVPSFVSGDPEEMAALFGYQNTNPNKTPKDTNGVAIDFRGIAYRFGSTGNWTRSPLGTSGGSAYAGTAPAPGMVDRRVHFDTLTFGASPRCIFVTFLSNRACLSAETIVPNFTPPPPLAISFADASSALTWQAGSGSVSIRATITGGKIPYTVVATGLPSGFTWDSSTNEITGNPTAQSVGSGTIDVTVTDANSNVASALVRYVVSAADDGGTTPPPPPPSLPKLATPGAPTLTAGSTRITVNRASRIAGGHEWQYRWRAGTSGAWTESDDDLTVSTRTITGLTNGTAYSVQVRRIATNTDRYSDSDWSATATATPSASRATKLARPPLPTLRGSVRQFFITGPTGVAGSSAWEYRYRVDSGTYNDDPRAIFRATVGNGQEQRVGLIGTPGAQRQFEVHVQIRRVATDSAYSTSDWSPENSVISLA